MAVLSSLILVLSALTLSCEAGVFGVANIMNRRYPNGPVEFHTMKVPIFRPTTRPLDQPVANPLDQPIANPLDQPVASPLDEPIANPLDQPIVADRSSSADHFGVKTVYHPVTKVKPGRWWTFQSDRPYSQNSYYWK
ncbi:uncharacterized protein [Cherax quadricarinatus]|nr:uncharacterized protein LOC128684285 [Cherax quadricarinatus]